MAKFALASCLIAVLLIGAAPCSASGSSTTIWLCRPGIVNDPCTQNIDATIVGAHGPLSIHRARAAEASPFDCFYVYPTLIVGPGDNAGLGVDERMRYVARNDVSQFSQLCMVWAPVYRQVTVAAIRRAFVAHDMSALQAASRVSYESALAAWRDYLAHDNRGRPFILVGTSQGAANLLLLIQSQIDSNPALRRRMVSAILVGANVTVRRGSDRGGSFANIPACRSLGQVNCVIAYSSYRHVPPPNSAFGTPGRGVSIFIKQPGGANLQTLCTNPAALSGGTASLDSLFRNSPPEATITTPWLEYRDLYTARCRANRTKTWLDVERQAVSGDTRPVLHPMLPPAWGLHEFDANLYMGDLIRDVRMQERRYAGGLR
ncbi:MAG TPA: DUF3089 domain-containing protein [Candidatus Baltobacteraceae bacterium]|nr:DUF3089 domain-containing protein [Candidatus Baltobacteraceae bacterium]